MKAQPERTPAVGADPAPAAFSFLAVVGGHASQWVAQAMVPCQAAAWRLGVLRRWGWVLLAITLLGGWLRLGHLDTPCLWGDEALTFGRTGGTYRDLLNRLQTDGFTPYHYQLLWWLRSGGPLAMRKVTAGELSPSSPQPKVVDTLWQGPVTLTPPTHQPRLLILGGGVEATPAVMRYVPALAGTLMIPAMFALAIQVASRRASLVVAAFTCVSAYLVAYSRDAKMYMPAWLFLVLHAACFLWWLRLHGRLAWLCWIAAGLLMGGFHASTLLILPVEGVVLLAWKRAHVRHVFLWVLGLVVVASGPAGYYVGFNQWVARTGGLAPGVAAEASASTGESPGWNRSGLSWVDDHNRGRSGPALVRDALGSYMLGVETPPEGGHPFWGAPDSQPAWISQATTSLLTRLLLLAAVGALPWALWLRGWSPLDPPPQAGYRTALLLGAWLLIPAYGFFYCRSIAEPMPILSVGRFLGSVARQTDWLDVAGATIGWRWVVAAIAFPGVVFACRWQWVLRSIVAAAVAGALLALGRLWLSDPNAGSHAFTLGERAIALVGHPVAITATAAIVPGVAFYLAGASLLGRLRVVGRWAFRAGAIVGCCIALHLLWQGMQAVAIQNGRGADWQSLWMPRYVAIVWPAVAIGIVVLLMRLPTAALRWSAVALLLGANLLASVGRLRVDTEAPAAAIAQDMGRWRNAESDTRVFVEQSPGMPAHRQTWVNRYQALYYLALELGYRPRPDEFMSLGYYATSLPAANDPELGDVLREARRSSHVRRVVLWQHEWSPAGWPTAPGGLSSSPFGRAVTGQTTLVGRLAAWALGVDRADAPVAGPPRSAPPSIGPDWRVVEDRVYEMRFWVNWCSRGYCRRTEYRR